MSTYTDVRDTVVSILQTIPSIGQVHNRMRWGANWSDLLEMLLTRPDDGGEPVLRGWMVSRSSILDEPGDNQAFGKVFSGYVFTIRGVSGFQQDEDSETPFQELIDEVRLALRRGGVGEDLYETSSAVFVPNSADTAVQVIDIRMFGSILAHYCEMTLTLTVEEEG